LSILKSTALITRLSAHNAIEPDPIQAFSPYETVLQAKDGTDQALKSLSHKAVYMFRAVRFSQLAL